MHARNYFKINIFWKRITKNPLKNIFWNIFRNIPVLNIYYQTKFDDAIYSGFWVISKITSANLCKPIHDIINYSTSICTFKSGNCRKQGKKIQKFDYFKNEKTFFDEMKNIFCNFLKGYHLVKTNYDRILVFYFEKVNKGHLKMLNVNYQNCQILLYCHFNKIIKEPGTSSKSPALSQKQVKNVFHMAH